MSVLEQPWGDLSALAAVEDVEATPAESERAVRQQKTEREVRDEEALRLQQMGVTFREIARQLGFSSPSQAHVAVGRARARAFPESNLEQKIDSTSTLDFWLRRLYSVAAKQDVSTSDLVQAALGVVRIEARRAKLWGLDAPSKRIVEHHIVTDEALAAEQAQLEAELAEMGVDLSLLPSVEDTLALMRAQAIDTTAVME